jgi:hypothetical protein
MGCCSCTERIRILLGASCAESIGCDISGSFSPRLDPALCISPPLRHTSPPGATTNSTYISRHCSRRECMKAFLSAQVVEQIAEQVSNSLHRRVKRGDLQFSHHVRPVTPDEIWIWICQRLQFSLEKRKTLRDQFNSVRSQAHVHFSPQWSISFVGQ